MTTQLFKGETLTRTKVRNNILKVWEMTDQDERKDWYGEALEWAQVIATVNEVQLSKVVGVIAALSPRKNWNQNLTCARDMVVTGNCGQMELFKDKARRILESDGTDETILSILNGNKIQAFYLNIRYPKDSTVTTIDRHALSVALGRWTTDEDYTGITDNQYAFFVHCYEQASDKVGVSPLLMQSATWTKWRKIKQNYR